MSLLVNPFFQIGAGLLARSGPSLQPINPYGGINDGLMAVQAARQDEQRAQMLQMQQQDMERKMARQREMDAYAATLTDPTARAFPQIAAQEALRAQYAATPPVKSVKVMTAAEAGYPALPPESLVEVQYTDGVAGDVSPWSPPAPTDGRTSAQKEYEFAVTQGYKGTFKAYQTEMKEAGATQLNMGGTDRISTTEAANMVLADGSPVLPGMPWEEVIAKGGRLLTGEEKAAASQRGTQEEKNKEALGKGESLFDNYKAAADAYDKGFLPYGEKNSQAKIARDALVTWYAKNVLGTPGAEPSPSLYERAEALIPDFGGPLDVALYPARMAEIERTINAALSGGKSDAKPRDDSGMGGVDYEFIDGKLVPVK